MIMLRTIDLLVIAEEAVNAMLDHAGEFGEKGYSAAAVDNSQDDDGQLIIVVDRNGPIIKEFTDDDGNLKRVNLLAVALSKLAEMVATGEQSGSKPEEGEVGVIGHHGWMGGKVGVEENITVLTSFSGAPQLTDLEIAIKGQETSWQRILNK
jgi:hypothetical protein